MLSTLADAISPACRIAPSLNMAPGDSRVVGYINAACQRLLPKGKWWGTCPKCTVQATNAIFALPPRYATIETIAVSRHPMRLVTQWYEFLESGWGVVNDPTSTSTQNMASEVRFRGSFPTFLDVPTGGGYKLQFQCDLLADVGQAVQVMGYDDSGNWIRTNPGSGYQDGETVPLAQTPGTSTVNNFSRVTAIQKPRTSGQVWLYANNGTNTLIGNYQYWETRPDYPRYLLPINPASQPTTQVDLVGKLAFIPAVNPTDYLVPGNLEAIRLAAMAIRLEETGTSDALQKASVLMNGRRDGNGRVINDGALTILDEELNHYRGSGAVIRPRLEQSGLPPVRNFI